jgi:hypothetical protein
MMRFERHISVSVVIPSQKPIFITRIREDSGHRIIGKVV